VLVATSHPLDIPSPVLSVAQMTSVGQECCLEYLQGTIPARKLMPWYRTSVEWFFPLSVGLLLSCSDPKDTRVKKAVRHMRSFMKSHGPLPRSPDSL
uniref:Uncharacterized protein n=1 Tax=Equus caballus TaxID=9796 RepID=A0A3Q2H454_HORSE